MEWAQTRAKGEGEQCKTKTNHEPSHYRYVVVDVGKSASIFRGVITVERVGIVSASCLTCLRLYTHQALATSRYHCENAAWTNPMHCPWPYGTLRLAQNIDSSLRALRGKQLHYDP